MSEMREGTPEWALAYMEDAARHTLLDEGSGTKELRKAVKIIATALAEAEARGRRQGLEEALALAKQAEAAWNTENPDGLKGAAGTILVAEIIEEALATAPAETQKPETGESA